MSNIFNIWTVINVFLKHYTHCPKCGKKELHSKEKPPREIVCKFCGHRFTPK